MCITATEDSTINTLVEFRFLDKILDYCETLYFHERQCSFSLASISSVFFISKSYKQFAIRSALWWHCYIYTYTWISRAIKGTLSLEVNDTSYQELHCHPKVYQSAGFSTCS